MREVDLYYINPFSILFVDDSGKLNRLFCPFKVQPISEITPEKSVVVEMVRKNPDNEILFIIEGKGIQHYHFKINSS
ncbi:hypothetical protein L0657_19835 [Dyadobacter sp. CY345]|uniref:hypothetical protein n=1 Tax=Dyadobacter sp. CY345 TaxID=2909335 RepID=UPI001F4729FB|nr:hypothetical protein [Dyadobacter sp. CY345]MCF2446218.1 hypothetical protein [Dyadobacter sp. CY345]